MAYAEKYYVIYCDRNNKQFRLGIYEWDYEGESVRHKAAPIPFSIIEETTSELKIGGIYPTRATVTLVSSKTFNMEGLYTADEHKYLVVHEPTDGSDDGKWYGNIIPNGFTEEMDNDVHYMILTASDNLPTLKLKLFTQDDGTNYGLPDGDFEQSFMWVAKEALKKTGFLLPIWTMVDIEPLLESTGSVRSLSVGFVSPSTIRIIDTTNTVDGMLQAGMSISVDGGVNNGSAFTIVSWTTTTQWNGSDLISVTVTETVVDSGGFENVTLSFYADAPTSSLSDPLAITVHDVRTYVRDQDIEGKNYYEVNGSAMTAWDVLNNLAKQWNAKIYQNNGRWEIVRWNALAVDSGEYQYFVYNSEGTQIGREDFGHDIVYPCKSTRFNFRPFGHSISMDRVLGAVGVNYLFKYKTEGDSFVNLIRNGNFSPPPGIQIPPSTANPATYTPDQWRRYSYSGLPFNLTYNGSPNPDAPPGHDSFLNIQGQFMYTTYLTSETGYSAELVPGDTLKIEIWYRADYMAHFTGTNALNQLCQLVVRIMVRESESNRKTLVNDGTYGIGDLANATDEVKNNPVNIKGRWADPVELQDDALSFVIGDEWLIAPGQAAKSPWRKYVITSEEVQIAGQLVVEIVGIGNPFPANVVNENWGPQYSFYDATGTYRRRMQNSLDFTPNKSGDITGVFVGKLVNPSSEAVPQIHPYWYTNDGAYTDQINDIEVLLGDDDNPDLVSNIYVMDGSTRRAIKSWDTWANDFGWGALGLILAKSVMQQYYRPRRIIDGDFVAPNIHWSSRIEFEERPGERYALLRGQIDYRTNRFSGTIVQVADESTPALPPGGHDGGSTVEPNWQPTGTVRCVRDENGENTGDQEQLEVDVNPSSQTAGQQRWVNIGANTGSCPIGEPIALYWGEQLTLDVGTLRYYPYLQDGDNYTVTYSNDGGDRYLRLLHRASLGTVQSILYPGGFESIAGWQYEADEIINGYTYKHLRLTWFVGVISDFPVIFVIS